MALNPALREMVTAATAKYQAEREERRGIIPLDPPDIDPNAMLVYDVAMTISEALTGPAIDAMDLAERLLARCARRTPTSRPILAGRPEARRSPGWHSI